MGTMKAGTYFIGDLYYVMANKAGFNWDKVMSLMYPVSTQKSVEGVLSYDKNGERIPFAIFNTKLGDGTYQDQFDNNYPVDSGLIGCIETKYLTGLSEEELLENGNVFTFDSDFPVASDIEDEGIIFFNHVFIVTDPSGDESEDWHEYA